MLCYESVVKNIMDVVLFFFFFTTPFIFSYSWFQYNILLFYFDLYEINTLIIIKIL